MEKVRITMKNSKDAEEISADRIDVLEIDMNGGSYYQIRYFRKGFSKSLYIEKKDVKKIIKG